MTAVDMLEACSNPLTLHNTWRHLHHLKEKDQWRVSHKEYRLWQDKVYENALAWILRATHREATYIYNTLFTFVREGQRLHLLSRLNQIVTNAKS